MVALSWSCGGGRVVVASLRRAVVAPWLHRRVVVALLRCGRVVALWSRRRVVVASSHCGRVVALWLRRRVVVVWSRRAVAVAVVVIVVCISGCQHQRFKRQKEVNLPQQLVTYHRILAMAVESWCVPPRRRSTTHRCPAVESTELREHASSPRRLPLW